MTSSGDKSHERTRTEISFKEIIDNAPIGILIFQRDWKIKFANNLFFRFGGVLAEDSQGVIGQSIFDNRMFDNADIREELLQLRNGESFEKQLVSARTITGGKISLYLKGAPIIFDNEVTGGILILEDIKSGLHESQLPLTEIKSFQIFLKLISDFYVIADVEGHIINAGQNESELFDFIFENENFKKSPDRKKLSSLLFKKLIENTVSSNQVLSTYIPFKKGAKEYTALVSIVPISADGLTIGHVILLFKDLDKEKEPLGLAGEAIEELARYEQITATVIDGLIGTNKSGKIILWNESSAKLFGLTRSEVFGKFIGKIFPTIDDKYFSELFETLHEKKEWFLELKIGDDEVVAEYFDAKVALIGEEDEETVLFLCSNVTSRIRREQELKKSEERFRNIVTNSHDFICTLDLRGRITYANPSFLEVFQYEEEEIQNLNFVELIDPYFLIHQTFKLSEIASEKTKSYELPLLSKLGQMIHVLASFSTVNDLSGGVQYYNIILTDITLKKDFSQSGGGALPELNLPTYVISIKSDVLSPKELEERLRGGNPPVIGRIKDNSLILDLRTIGEGELTALAALISKAFRIHPKKNAKKECFI